MSCLKIAFFHVGTPCHGKTKFLKPLGGTESALIDMAEALAARGHQVHVFTVLDEQGVYQGVDYHHFQEFESYSAKNNWDVFIGLRQLLPLLVKRWAAYQIYFTPDAYDQPFFKQTLNVSLQYQNQNLEVSLYSLNFVSQWVDKIYCVGQWQAQTLSHVFQIPLSKFFIAGNGVYPERFSPLPFAQRKKRIVYASTPFRGLNYLLEYFSELLKANPDLECWVMSGMQLYGLSHEEDQKQYSEIYKMANQEGVKLIGPVSKEKLYSIFSESMLMAYPNTFPETFCISVLEAQAAGLPVVTSKLAALEERIDDEINGYLVSGHPGEKNYKEKFCALVNQVLQNQSLWERLSQKAIHKSSLFSYQKLAEAWEKDFEEFAKKNSAEKINRENVFMPKSEIFRLGENEVQVPKGVILKHLAETMGAYNFLELQNNYEQRVG